MNRVIVLIKIIFIFSFLLISCVTTNQSKELSKIKSLSHSKISGDFIVFLFNYGKPRDSLQKAGFLNTKGEILFNKEFHNISPFYGKYANVIKDGKFGYVDLNGNTTFMEKGLYAYWYYLDIGIVRNEDRKYGLIDRKGNIVVPIEYDNITFPNAQGEYAAKKNNESYILFSNGKKKRIKYDILAHRIPFNNTISFQDTTKKRNNKGLVNYENTIITSTSLNTIYSYYDKHKLFVKRDFYELIDVKKNLTTNFNYEKLKFNSNIELIPAKKDGKWGYIDINNVVVIDFQFDDAYFFNEGIACVQKNREVGFINTNGELIIDYQYETHFNSKFQEGLGLIKKNKKFGFINKYNTIVIPPLYKKASPFKGGLSIVLGDNDLYGAINKTNDTIVPFKYFRLYEEDNGLLRYLAR